MFDIDRPEKLEPEQVTIYVQHPERKYTEQEMIKFGIFCREVEEKRILEGLDFEETETLLRNWLKNN